MSSSDRSAQFHDQTVCQGNGGETHQRDGNGQNLTTAQGCPISDNQNSLTAGPRGPVLLEDFVLREKIFHFDHERIPERVVHARGVGAHGYFENYECLSDLTSADIFQRAGEKTPAFTRFSTVAGNKGSPDVARDVRGFAVKMYTKEGNWDIVGNNIPVFFIQDAMKFPDLVHAAKAEPDRGFPQAQTAHDNFWDFISLSPESMHMAMWIMSDRTIPRSVRTMEGFGIHTFRLINKDGKATFVKFHWKPLQGLQSVVWNEAVKINGADPDFHRRDLWEAISKGDFPEWELGIQILDEDFIEKFPFDILDSTKLVPEELVPVRPVGKLVLNRLVDNFFAETEQVAFCTSNIVPGMDFSDDPLLQGRNFSYLDTQLKRLGGPNYTHLPINAPKCPFHNFRQDGHMAFTNVKGRANYEPNSWSNSETGPREATNGFKTHPQPVSGPKTRTRSETFSDHYSQARQFYISQASVEQKHMADALVFELSKVKTPVIRARMVSHLLNIDEDLAKKVADGLGLKEMPAAADAARPTLKDLKESPALSIVRGQKKTLKGRKIGCMVSDGVDDDLMSKLRKAVEDEGAIFAVVSPKIGGVTTAGGKCLEGDEKIGGGPSVLFDAVVVALTKEGTDLLINEGVARDFVADAFAHVKYIGYTAESKPLMRQAGIPEEGDEAIIDLQGGSNIPAFISAAKNLRFWDREPKVNKV